jgi:molybdenum cofactor cytidylyltransferase
VLPDLLRLHGDKAVWKLLDQRAAEVVEVASTDRCRSTSTPWEDYERLLSSTG